MHDMPRAGRSHAAHVAGAIAADAVVHRLPSTPGNVRTAARGRVPHGLRAAVRPAGARTAARRGIPHTQTDELRHVPPMTVFKLSNVPNEPDPFSRWAGDDIDPRDPVARRTFLK